MIPVAASSFVGRTVELAALAEVLARQ
ncbi:MAG: hypothetical protein QOH17_42, partial [Pseudonocardiales bacterium]|nr:hypothetical protein [Pseudonocardiales bacterium]